MPAEATGHFYRHRNYLVGTAFYPALLVRSTAGSSLLLVLNWLSKSVRKCERKSSAVANIFNIGIDILVVYTAGKILRIKNITYTKFQASFIFQNGFLNSCIQSPHRIDNNLSFNTF